MAQGKFISVGRTAPFARSPRALAGRVRGGDPHTSRPALGRQAVLLLAVQGMFAAAGALSGTFVPVYLWKASQSHAAVGWFALAQHLASGCAFWLAGAWVKRHDKTIALRAGLAASALFYLAVLLLGDAAAGWTAALGALNGLAVGLFWLAYNVVYFEITDRENRDRFNGWAGLLTSLAGMAAPWLSGTFITLSGGTRGYRIVFATSLAMFAGAALLSLFLEKRRTGGAFDWSYGLSQLRTKDNPWRSAVPALAAQGLREGVWLFLLGLLVYFATGREQSVGGYNFWTSLTALGSFWLAGRLLRPRFRRAAMLAGAAAVSGLPAILLADTGYAALLATGVGTALFMPLYIIPMTSAVFDLVGRTDEDVERREELIVLRETGLCAGRVLGLAIYLAVVAREQSPAALAWLLLAVGAAPLAGWLFMRRQLSA
ncbi:MAG: MFS transporter [Thermobacillus sp. ZCTH02-B1]|nr:MAG: MFS transporter [Thermobacillus sp. ZCTH02-B1]